ncbi:protocadherin-15-like [Oncorhynchus nerka]|uniref:protocadherin-15-like n=1 Tax=Oncorhynchus nerka TaxID=8023 RepID=UPI0031B897C1
MRPPKHDPAKPHCFLTHCSLNPEVSHTNVSEETLHSWAKRFEIDEADRQRRLSSFACRANSSCGNGSLHSILPKSESNVTFLSDHHPLTTTNPLYDEEEDGNFSSPYGTAKRGSFSPSLSGGSGNVWTMRTRLRGGSEGYESLKRQALMDPAQWELQLLQAGMKGQGSLEGYDVQSSRSTEESKLSVREQARQYEQQAMQERTPRGGRDSRGSLTSPPLLRNQDNIDMLELSAETLFSIMDSPYSPLSIGKDVPPRIIITQGEGSPPLAQRPTLPVLRTSISSYITAEPCEITVEIIPDPPENPPPPPPSPHSPPPHSPPPPPPSQTPHSGPPPPPASSPPPPPSSSPPLHPSILTSLSLIILPTLLPSISPSCSESCSSATTPTPTPTPPAPFLPHFRTTPPHRSVCPNLPAAIVLAPPYFLPGPSPSSSPPTRGRCEEEGAKGDSEKPAEPR